MQGTQQQTLAGAAHGAAILRASVRRELPAHAFSKNPRKLAEVCAYLAVIWSCYGVLRQTDAVWLCASCAFLLGLCHLSLGFIAHDVTHGSVVRGKLARSVIESLLWGMNATSAAAWIVNHNRIHHQHTNGRHDSFRYFAKSEASPATGLYSLLFLPNRHLPWNPLVFQIYAVQIWMHTLGVAFGGGRKHGAIGPITNLGVYSTGHRVRLYAELVLIVLLQLLVFGAVGGDWHKYLWAGPVALSVASTGASAYLFTQHSLHRLVEEDDPLMTTSLRLPRWVDVLHSNHSHHTAHHLFPGMRSDVYPLVTQLMQRDHPRSVHVLRFVECWKLLFRNRVYKADVEQTPSASDALPHAAWSDRDSDAIRAENRWAP